MNDKPVDTDKDVYRVVVANPDGSTTEVVATHVIAGLYEALFTPQFGGDYDITVTMSNESEDSAAVGTAFTVKVIELPSLPV